MGITGALSADYKKYLRGMMPYNNGTNTISIMLNTIPKIVHSRLYRKQMMLLSQKRHMHKEFKYISFRKQGF